MATYLSALLNQITTATGRRRCALGYKARLSTVRSVLNNDPGFAGTAARKAKWHHEDSRSHTEKRLVISVWLAILLLPQPLQLCDNALAGTDTKEEKAAPVSSEAQEPPFVSLMEKYWDLDPKLRTQAPPVQWYRPCYILLAAYNNSPNENSILDIDPRAKAQKTEMIFQLSGKLRLTPDKPICKWGKCLDAWVGYTQHSFWQFYNSPFSSPFRDTNYEPEGFFTVYDDPAEKRDLPEHRLLNWRILNIGFNHQSNGRSRPLSRSWNRLFAEFGFEKLFTKKNTPAERNEFNLFVKAWYRLPENSEDDDNPDIDNYLGYGEILGVYYRHGHRFSLMLRNNLRGSENKGAVQLEWSIPLGCILGDKISLYLQYFNGYGECLLDYNSSSNRISAGIMILNW